MNTAEKMMAFAQKHAKGRMHCKSCGTMHSKNHVHFKRYRKHSKTVSVSYKPGDYKESEEVKAIRALNEMHQGVHSKHYKKPKLGSGKRFAQLKGQLAKKGARNPGALAAFIGRKKYGNKKFASLAKKGK